MRLFFILFLLSFKAFAQLDTGSGAIALCDENTFLNDPPTDPATNTYDCQDVQISTPLTATNDPSRPLTIRATGTIDIADDVLFQGSDGSGVFGGAGGPGAGNGGSYFGGGDAGLGGAFAPANQGGRPPTQSSNCNAGVNSS